MSAARREPRIVAELGRPETPEETAARKAENTRAYRARKTVNNLVLSLLVTVAAVVVLVMIVPRSDTPIDRTVDYRAVAGQVQPGVEEPLASPRLPDGWRANAATWRSGGSDKVASWYIGLLTPADAYIGLNQGIDANPSWVSEQLQGSPAAETVTLDGIQWDVYRNTAPEDERGNFDYALVTTAGTSTFLLIGTAAEAEFTVLAGALTDTIARNTNGDQG
ncbi:DUF4245 domain-containing protein [Cryobacterium sp. Sr8]|uniref:DUF4245 domain-containing protein n=1 Tax=Cryobacterium sp. Sr8 TaxID=1259203 RepID=UPI00106B3A7A|nr:DUF4245 domain-containing protein [Cryobacterium sp. Sr8]TFD80087.1 DUF4245 domain-containing protein [Cryobacterium sp. Sr8]